VFDEIYVRQLQVLLGAIVLLEVFLAPIYASAVILVF
jgi:hypothetical protein